MRRPLRNSVRTCHSHSAFWLEGDLCFSVLWLAAEPPSGVGIGRGDMSTRVGKTVWVRDPALADEAVFSKGKVISEDPQQVCALPRVCGAVHGPDRARRRGRLFVSLIRR